MFKAVVNLTCYVDKAELTRPFVSTQTGLINYFLKWKLHNQYCGIHAFYSKTLNCILSTTFPPLCPHYMCLTPVSCVSVAAGPGPVLLPWPRPSPLVKLRTGITSSLLSLSDLLISLCSSISSPPGLTRVPAHSPLGAWCCTRGDGGTGPRQQLDPTHLTASWRLNSSIKLDFNTLSFSVLIN